VALTTEEAEKVLASLAKEREESANFANVLEAKVERAYNDLQDLINEKKLVVKEVTSNGMTPDEERQSLLNWLEMFILGMLPGINESGFMVAGEKYTRNVYTVYSASCSGGYFAFEDLEEIPYTGIRKFDKPVCYYSEKAQLKAAQLVQSKLNPIVALMNGHYVLTMNGKAVRRYVERQLLQNVTTKQSTLDMSAFLAKGTPE
jgi:hypothetical protein